MDAAAQRRFREFVAQRTPALMRVSYLLAGDQHAAEDLLQTALTKTAARWRHKSSLGLVSMAWRAPTQT